MFVIIPSSFYHTFYLILFALLVSFQSLKLSETNNRLLYQTSNPGYGKALILSIFLIIFFGSRDPNSIFFADTMGYASRYNIIKEFGKNSVWYSIISSQSSEIIWSKILLLFAQAKLGVSIWFTFISCVYILSILFSLKKFFPNHIYLSTVFAFLNFGFYGGAVNGIRSGMALSLILLALSLIIGKQRKLIGAFILMLIAFEIHTSVVLPIICILVSIYFIKKPKLSIVIWCISILGSLFLGNFFTSFFSSLGFDDRLSSYMDYGQELSTMDNISTKIGFRWDFLIFSAVPIIWGWWIIKKKGLNDKAYNIIFNTYVLANSFWVLVIRAAFSNRFAALSWFLYFLVLIYPLLKHNIYPKQGVTLTIMLIGLFLINIVI